MNEGTATATATNIGAARFGTGLVVGKFAPLHLGHEWLVEQAALQCDRLLILSYTQPEFERCDVPTRQRWLAARFPRHEAHAIDDAWLHQRCAALGIATLPLPQNSAPDATHQHFLAWMLREVLRSAPDALFTSEAYGEPCAQVLSAALGRRVHAITVDLQRSHLPISATRIREDVHGHGQWLAPEVRATFVQRIALLGGESTGKTTLAAALAQHFNTLWVAEFGRELWERQRGQLSEADLLHIAQEQAAREQASLPQAHRYLFCDTSPLTTLGYSHWMFGRADPALATLAERPYDGVVLCSPDFGFVQDGTRRDDRFRHQQQAWYRERLSTLPCPPLEVSGSLPQRVARVAAWLAAGSPAELAACHTPHRATRDTT